MQSKMKMVLVMALLVLVPVSMFAASHREAPITALDRAADITDWYAFVSYHNPNKVVMILNVDPLLEPANGPTYFPFDPNIVYAMHVDNNNDGFSDDVVFEFRFTTEYRMPDTFTAYVGGIAGIPPITALDGTGSDGLNLRQHYTVTMIKNGVSTDLTGGRTLYAIPSNVGNRTMPSYNADIYEKGIYDLGNGFRTFAGTVNDPFFIDLGAAFDSLNFRMAAGGGVLSEAVDSDDTHNYAPDSVSGYNVNSIVLEVDTKMLTVDGKLHNSGEKQAVLGTYGSTSRPSVSVRRSQSGSGGFAQVQRMGNPLVNELIIGIGSKDKYSTDEPENDAQFSNFVLHPQLADVFASIGIPVPTGDRTDLLALVQYEAPICPGCGPNDTGVIADLLRLNTGIPATAIGQQKRLGFLVGDSAGFPNGRRPIDDVVDIAARVVAGILVDPVKFGTRIGDGVNTDGDNLGFRTSFPYVRQASNGRDSHHVGPGQQGCTGYASGTCPKK